MNYRKFRKNVKAISPIISVLLMIAIAVVASLVVYAWVMGYIGFTTANTGKAIQIQSASDASGSLVVYVQNIGTSAVSFSNPCVYVNGTAYTASGSPSLGPISVGSTVTLTTTYTPTSGETDVIKVASSSGTYSQITQTMP